MCSLHCRGSRFIKIRCGLYIVRTGEQFPHWVFRGHSVLRVLAAVIFPAILFFARNFFT